MGWTRLDSALPRSTIWQEPSDTRVVWITMLALANKYGVVESSLPGLAHESRVSLEAAALAIDRFMSPDPYSRNPENEGRRIEAVPGGWRLLNHGAYRMTPKELSRERVRRHRAKKEEESAKCQPVEPAPPPTIAGQAKAMESTRGAPKCPKCGRQLRRFPRRDGSGEVYGHGRDGGCDYVIGVGEFDEEAAKPAPKLCSCCGERQVLGPGYERGEDLCGPCQVEVTRGR